MIESSNITGIKAWLAANSNEVGLDTLPEAYRVQARRELTELVSTGQQVIDVQATMTALTRYRQVVAAYNQLRSLAANLDLERLRNDHLYEIAVLEGEIKKAIASQRGAFKSELAALEGQNALALSALENEGRLLLAREIIPLDREGKLRIATTRGANDAEIAELDNAMKLALAQVRGAFDVAMAGVDAKAIGAESRVAVESIAANAAIDSYGIIREGSQDAFYLLNAANLKAGFAEQDAAQRVGSIGETSRISATYETLINNSDRATTELESQLKLTLDVSDTNLRIDRAKTEGIIERGYLASEALSNAEFTTLTAQQQVIADAALTVAKHKYDIDKVGAEITNARALAEAEAGFTIDQGRQDVDVKGRVSDLDLRIRSNSAMSDLGLTLQEARLTSQASTDKSGLRIGHGHEMASIEIGGMYRGSFQKITLADKVADQREGMLRAKSLLAVAMTEGRALQDVSNTNVKAILTRSAVRGMADDAYLAEKGLTDEMNSLVKQLANDELGYADTYNGFYKTISKDVADYMREAGRAIAVYGAHREHYRYYESVRVAGFPAGLLPSVAEPTVPTLGTITFT